MVDAPFDVDAFLEEDRRLAQVASVSASGAPLLGSLWFAFERGRFWFSSAADSPLPRAARRGAPAAVIVDDFDPPASIRQIRIRGRAQIEPHDPAVVTRIYRRYLGHDIGTWPQFFQSRIHQANGWLLWSIYPDSGLAVTSLGFDEHICRWAQASDAPFRR